MLDFVQSNSDCFVNKIQNVNYFITYPPIKFKKTLQQVITCFYYINFIITAPAMRINQRKLVLGDRQMSGLMIFTAHGIINRHS